LSERMAGMVWLSCVRKLRSAVQSTHVGPPTGLNVPHLPQTMPIWCFSPPNKLA
jgi:hypothetical protein